MKNSTVLALNKSYVALHLVSWGKAISLCYQDHARALDREYLSYHFEDWLKFSSSPSAETYRFVHTVSLKIAVPEIIVLQSYNRLPDKEVKYSRTNLFRTYDNKCCYCGGEFPDEELTIEHIIPRSFDKHKYFNGGSPSTWENTVPACKPCNFSKKNRTPEQAGLKLLYQPRKPKWISPKSKKEGNEMLPSWEHFLSRQNVLLGD